MSLLSSFHEVYKKNKEFYDKEAKKLLKGKFMDKYQVGNTIYNMYFDGMNGRKYKIDGVKISRHHGVIHQKLSSVEDYLDEYNKNLQKIATSLKVELWVAKELNEKYTITELMTAKWIDGEISVNETVVMRKTTNYKESMFCLNCSMV